jgi:PAS domain S-box-containing protein
MGQKMSLKTVKSETNHHLEWQQIFDALPDLVAVIDLDHKISRVNKAMADTLGVKPDELIGKHCFSLMHGTEHPPDFCPHTQLISDLKYHENEFPIEILQGEYLVSVSPILNKNGALTGSVHIAHNISERKKLGKLNRYLASIVESSDDAIIGKDLDGKIVSWNKGAENMFGYTKEEVLDKNIFIIVPANMFKDYEEVMEQIRTGKSIKHHDTVRMKKDGRLVDVSLHISPMYDSNCIVSGSSTIAHDITERKEMEKILRESEKKYREVFNNTNDMISLSLINEKGYPVKFFDINNIGVERYGYTRSEFLNMTPADIVAPDQVSKISQVAKILLKDGHAEFEVDHITKDGRRFPVEINNHLVVMDGKKLALAVVRDIEERKKAEAAIMESEEKFREVFNNANDAMFLHKMTNNAPGNFMEVNDEAVRTLGYTKKELLEMNPNDINSSKTRQNIPSITEILLKKGKATFESEQVTQKGKIFPVEINSHIFKIRDENYILSIARDITDRKKAEEDLKKSEMKYRTIFENVQDVFYRTDMDGIITEMSPSIERYSGYKRSELIGKPVIDIYSNNEDRVRFIQHIIDNGEAVDYELVLETKNKKKLYVSTNAHFLYDLNNIPVGIEGSLRDISERKHMEIVLKKSLKEKEMLLKEIHHRVKNNLMIISSLLSLQSNYITDKASKNIFRESQNRARSMALIHEKLYQSTDLKRIDFGEYIRSLCNELVYTYAVSSSKVQINYNVEEIYLDINTAIPLGLIANELITNSLKYAFPEGQEGYIDINFSLINDEYVFSIKDNGIGFPEDLDYKNTESLGLQLVNNLTDQIDGLIELNIDYGTEFKIRFNEIKI